MINIMYGGNMSIRIQNPSSIWCFQIDSWYSSTVLCITYYVVCAFLKNNKIVSCKYMWAYIVGCRLKRKIEGGLIVIGVGTGTGVGWTNKGGG